MDESIQALEPFEPHSLLAQIQELAETLLKVKTGSIPEDEVEALMFAVGDAEEPIEDEPEEMEFMILEEELCAPKSKRHKQKRKRGKGLV